MFSAYEVFDVHLNCIYHADKLNRKFNAECDAYLQPLTHNNRRVQWLCLTRRHLEVLSSARTPLCILLLPHC